MTDADRHLWRRVRPMARHSFGQTVELCRGNILESSDKWRLAGEQFVRDKRATVHAVGISDIAWGLYLPIIC